MKGRKGINYFIYFIYVLNRCIIYTVNFQYISINIIQYYSIVVLRFLYLIQTLCLYKVIYLIRSARGRTMFHCKYNPSLHFQVRALLLARASKFQYIGIGQQRYTGALAGSKLLENAFLQFSYNHSIYYSVPKSFIGLVARITIPLLLPTISPALSLVCLSYSANRA